MNTFTISNRQLAYVVKTASAAVATNEELPIFRHIHLAVTDGVILARATDRYRAIIVRGEATGTFTGMVHIAALKRIVATFTSTRKSSAQIRFDQTEETLKVTRADGDLLDLSDAELVFDAADYEFPRIDHIFRKGLDGEQQANPLTVNPTYLRQLPSDAAVGEPVRVLNPEGPGRPVQFVHRNWLMSLMQMRTGIDDKVFAEWSALIPATTKKRGKAA